MKILTALDRSEYAEIVLEHGLDQAARGTAPELHFLTTITHTDDSAAARAWLDDLVRDGLDEFDLHLPYQLHVFRGDPADTVVTLARDLAVDLLVVGRFHVPSTSDRIVELSEVPTLVVGADGRLLAPQCPDCAEARRSQGRMFCERHSGDKLRDSSLRVPPFISTHDRMW